MNGPDFEQPLRIGQSCQESLAALYFFLDGELTPERSSQIRHHVDECQPCLEAFDFEAELRQAVRAACGNSGRVPAELRMRIAGALGLVADQLPTNFAPSNRSHPGPALPS